MRNEKYNKPYLEGLVKDCNTYAELCRALGVKPSTGAQSHVKKVVLGFDLDVSHFQGLGWAKGKKRPPKRPISDYLTNKVAISSHQLKLRLFSEGLKEKACETCGLSKWLGEEIVFHLDHINSNTEDNSLCNLMIVCPNCHALKTRKNKLRLTKLA